MRFLHSRLFPGLLGFAAVASGINPAVNAAGPLPPSASDHARIVAHWTPERVAAAIPRDLVIDERGQGYLRKPDGSLEPYGQAVAASVPATRAKPVGPGDAAPPVISDMDPGSGATIGSSHTFTAVVTDDTGVRSVVFNVGKSSGARQSFAASRTTGNEWAVSLQGFTDGDWVWNVLARDKARTTTSGDVKFKVSISGGGGSGVIPNAEWTEGGVVQTAAGRIYFEMPEDAQRTRWGGYVCSGTVVTDSTNGRSLIQTAAHCVYDDANKAFARNVMFIPNQAGTSGTRTDFNCGNDPLGCWTAAFGVVDVNWTRRTFPNNVAWDYAYYVVHDTGAHTDGFESTEDRLDVAAKSLGVSFAEPKFDDTRMSSDYTHALGYSYDMDPHFMYCAEDLHSLDTANWWLGSCDLSGGSSGGPWVQPMDVTTGSGPIISVNSWGYTNRPGMAGPKLSGTTASVVFACAKNYAPASLADGDAGLKSPGDCN